MANRTNLHYGEIEELKECLEFLKVNDYDLEDDENLIAYLEGQGNNWVQEAEDMEEDEYNGLILVGLDWIHKNK